MMKESVNPHHTVTLGQCSGFSVFTRGFDVAQLQQLCVLTSPWSEKEASSVHKDVKDSRDLVEFWREPNSQMLLSLRYLTVKVHGKALICMDTD